MQYTPNDQQNTTPYMLLYAVHPNKTVNKNFVKLVILNLCQLTLLYGHFKAVFVLMYWIVLVFPTCYILNLIQQHNKS